MWRSRESGLLAAASCGCSRPRIAATAGTPAQVCGNNDAVFDPGERWEYGSNIDWVGQVVEGITGQRLGEVFRRRIFEPLGMQDMTFEIDDRIRARLAGMHARHPDGRLEAMDFELPAQPEVHFGGHGLYGTVGDYMKFIRMWLNDGRSDSGEQILRPETVEMASRNHLPKGMHVKMLPGVDATKTAASILPVSRPRLSNDAEFFPGMPKPNWTYGALYLYHGHLPGR